MKEEKIADRLGNVGLIRRYGKLDESVFIIKRTSEPKPIPDLILEKRGVKELNGHFDEKAILKAVRVYSVRDFRAKKDIKTLSA